MGIESSTRVPNRRLADLVVTESGGDILLYDQRTFALHTLNDIVVRVWENLDNAQTLRDLTVLSGLDVETVKQSLKQLEEANLLDGALPAEARPTGSRRSFLKKAGLAAAAVPVIASVTAPMAAAQTSGVTPVRRATIECGTSNTCTGVDCNAVCAGVTCPAGWSLETPATCLAFNPAGGGAPYLACGIGCIEQV